MKKGKEIFFYKGRKYYIDSSKKVDSIGDFYEKKRIVYIDKNMPKKFHEGIMIHEIEERKLIKKGHSYGWSHNQAQKKETEFYEKKFGDGEKMIKEEEKIVIRLFMKYTKEDKKKLKKKCVIGYNQGYSEKF